MVKLLLMASILLSLVGEVGLVAPVLPDRRVPELSDDWEEDRFRTSSARMSSKETLRWGWLIGTSSRFSTKREAMVVDTGLAFGVWGEVEKWRRRFYNTTRGVWAWMSDMMPAGNE
jgi:hypothetical protein